MGYDLGFTIGAYVGGNNVDVAQCAARQQPAEQRLRSARPASISARVFGTIGTPTFGTVKIGRDLGLFGSDAILNDLTLLGIGSPLATNTRVTRRWAVLA